MMFRVQIYKITGQSRSPALGKPNSASGPPVEDKKVPSHATFTVFADADVGGTLTAGLPV